MSKYVWVHDTNVTTCANHALADLRERMIIAEHVKDSIIETPYGTWMRVYAADADKIGLRCMTCGDQAMSDERRTTRVCNSTNSHDSATTPTTPNAPTTPASSKRTSLALASA